MKMLDFMIMKTPRNMQTVAPPHLGSEELLPVIPHILQADLQSADQLLIRYGTFECTYRIHYVPDWSERAFQNLLKRVKAMSASVPLVVLPYLDQAKQEQLLKNHVDGMDLNGNMVLTLRQRTLIYIHGFPNGYRMPAPQLNVYQGKSALVGRALLHQPAFHTLQEIEDAITAGGSSLSVSLISRALKSLREDVLVESSPPYRAYLLQPDRLLDQLVAGWEQTQKKRQVLWRGRVAQPHSTFLPQLFANASDAGQPVIMTGIGSASHHTSITMENVAYLYAERPEPLLKNLSAVPGERFANLEIIAPPDPGVFFSAEQDDVGIRWASPVQTYLEMQTGDQRLQQSAEPLRDNILNHVKEWLADHES